MITLQLCTGIPALDSAIKNLTDLLPGCTPFLSGVRDWDSAEGFRGAVRIYYLDLTIDQDCQSLIDLLHRHTCQRCNCRVLVVVDHAGSGIHTLRWQQKLLEAGVFDILERPLNLQRVRNLIESFQLDLRAYRVPVQAPQTVAADPARLLPGLMPGEESAAMAIVQRKIRKVADLETNVLLTGETGVGKTYWANQIHSLSKRSAEPFVVVNCANFTPTLAESQLFGHVKGAFTGADQKHQGHFETVGCGTIFLDELDSLPLDVQGKLLRVVEEREYRAVGDRQTKPLLARIVSATNCDLNDRVAGRDFRADLYFRMNAYEIAIPPLRQRLEELDRFAQLFVAEFCSKNQLEVPRIATELLEALHQHPWPGNLRELRNTIEYAAIDAEDGLLRVANLPPAWQHQQRQISQAKAPAAETLPTAKAEESPELSLDDSGIRRLVGALVRNNHNRTKAAQELGVSRMTVYNLMKRFGFR